MSKKYNRILIVRTDRIGDVILSTPVIKALRSAFPESYISMMVRPYTKDIVEGNPYLNEVIVYDKDKKEKSWLSSVKFAFMLRKKKFDLAVILHPINRVNIMTFIAGIPQRVGYNRKFGFLLTKKILYAKHLGQRHELEYTLDVLRTIGIEPKDKSPFVPIRAESEKYIDDLLQKNKVSTYDKIIAIHPGASCASRIWPQDKYAKLADCLIDKYNAKIIIISDEGQKDITDKVLQNVRNSQGVIDFTGKTSISQLTSFLRRARLLISNDSGPVHLATAVGTPVIAIFGRKEPGVAPLRWKPVGQRDKFLQKDVGCRVCLAHNCKNGFNCLKAIMVEDVLSCVDEILNL